MSNKSIAIVLVIFSLFLGILFGLFINETANVTLNKDSIVIREIKMSKYNNHKGGYDIYYTYKFYDTNITLSSKHKYNIGDTLYIKN